VSTVCTFTILRIVGVVMLTSVAPNVVATATAKYR
jgi:hypothetical protein